MKSRFLLTLACLVASGCVHRESLCGNMVFIFIEGEVRTVEGNFRDDRLLHSDALVRGTMTQWRPGPLWKVHGYFTVNLELETGVPIENAELSVVHGRQGADRYASVPLLQSPTFVGRKQLVSFDIGGDAPEAKIVLYFGANGDQRRREIDVLELWTRPPNKSVETTGSTGSQQARETQP